MPYILMGIPNMLHPLLRTALAALGILLVATTHAQPLRPTKWHEFYSYTLGKRALSTGQGALLVCQQAILQYQGDGLLHRLSTTQGLAGAQIVDANYDPSGAALIVAYADGTIDIAAPSERFTITQLRDATPGTTPLPIHRVAINTKASYALTETHLLRIARKQGHRVESIRIWRSDQARALTLHDVAKAGLTLYVATDEGVYFAHELQDGQLAPLEKIPGLNDKALRICASPCNRTVGAWIQKDGALQFVLHENGVWRVALANIPGKTLEITSDEAAFWACNGSKIWRIDHTGSQSLFWDDATLPPQAQIAPQSACSNVAGVFVASERKGLLRINQLGQYEALSPHSPEFATAYRILLTPNSGPIFTAGGYSPVGTPRNREFGLYYGAQKLEILPNTLDAGAIALLSEAADHYLIGTSSHGVLEIEKGQIVAQYNASNTPILAVSGSQGTVCDLLIEPNGSWWVLSLHGSTPLLHRTPQGVWTALPLPPRLDTHGARLHLSPTGSLWITSPNTSRLAAIHPEEYLQTSGEKGHATQRVFLPHTSREADPYDIDFDSKNQMWLATGQTVLTASNHDALLKGEDISFSTILFPDPDWSEQAAHQLTDVQCTAIMVDAGNGLWVGSSSGAVYHIDPVSKSLVKRYLPQQSPLPGGRINDLAFDGDSGLVYVASEHGVVALQAESMRSATSYDDIRIYPNPLRPNMPNEITIDGLKENSILKITDVAGQLVRELRSLGGRAIWDTKNGRGHLVNSGVYLIFLSDETGQDTAVERIAIIR